MTGKGSVCWSGDESLQEKEELDAVQDTVGYRNQTLSLSCALVDDESPLGSFENYFLVLKNCPNFHKESLRHTQHYTVNRTITVERNWFNPFKQMKTTSTGHKLPITSTLICWNQLYLKDAGWSHFRANQSIPQVKEVVWHLATLEPSALHELFFQGELWVHIKLTSVAPSLKQMKRSLLLLVQNHYASWESSARA